MPPSQIAQARALAERRGHGVFRTEEAPYSILNRVLEYDLLPTCARLGVGVLAFGPLAGGWLSGRYRNGQTVATSGPRSHRPQMDANAPGNAAKLAAADALGALADDSDLTLVQLATAWAARHPAVSSVVIGPRTMEQLEGYLDADGVELSDEVLDRIDSVVAPGVTIDVADALWAHGTRALDAAQRRRQPPRRRLRERPTRATKSNGGDQMAARMSPWNRHLHELNKRKGWGLLVGHQRGLQLGH